MKIVRLGGLLLFAVVAMGLVAVSSVSAAQPLFVPASGQTVTGTSGASILLANNGADVIQCRKGVFSGVVASSLLIGKGVVHYLECESSGNGGATFCPIKSSGAPAENLLITKTLHGILGLILPSRATGILFLPAAGKVFVELEGNACTIETGISGNIAGLVEPTGKSQTTGKVIFEREAGPGVNEEILDIDLTHGLGLVKPQLTMFSTNAVLTQLEEVTFGVATEVT